MASEKFNVLNGISVGIPPVNVVDNTGNVVSNFNNLSGNVSANRIFANQYLYANGTPLIGGSNTTLLFNNSGTIDGTANLSYDIANNTLRVTNLVTSGITNLGIVANVKISGGNPNQLLSTDGNSNLVWKDNTTSYNTSELPAASSSVGVIAFVLDGPRPNRPVFSDGVNWRFVSDDTILI